MQRTFQLVVIVARKIVIHYYFDRITDNERETIRSEDKDTMADLPDFKIEN